MKTESGIIFLESISRYSPGITETSFVDKTETHFIINNKEIIRLYEGIKNVVEKKLNRNWEDYCDKLFEKNK
jgi:hypothetical protein